jgi:hypothetical protein
MFISSSAARGGKQWSGPAPPGSALRLQSAGTKEKPRQRGGGGASCGLADDRAQRKSAAPIWMLIQLIVAMQPYFIAPAIAASCQWSPTTTGAARP